MSLKRKILIISAIGILTLVLEGVFPPWAPVIAGATHRKVPYHWVFSPPVCLPEDDVMRVDGDRLNRRHLITILITLSAIGVAVLRERLKH